VTIRNCYNVGDIHGSRIVGGVSGRLYRQGVVETCYNVGVITMEDSAEKRVGLVGGINGNAGKNQNLPGTVTDSYYLKNSAYVDVEKAIYYNTTGVDGEADLRRGIALAGTAMKGTALLRLGFDDEIWTAKVGDYPILKNITVIGQYVEELMPEVPSDGKICYVNDYMDTAISDLDLYVASSTDEKQDGFVFVYKNEVFVHDGGNKDTSEGSTYRYLYDLRKSLLPEGVAVSNTGYKLKITLVISHFHSDHVNALIHNIIPSPYFEVTAAYYPEMSDFEHTAYYEISTPTRYTDGAIGSKGRAAFLAAMKKAAPYAAKHVVAFGKTEQIRTADGQVSFDLYAPCRDWGEENGAKYILDTYYKGGASGGTADGLPTAVVNANSMWMKITYGDRTMLFTGDVMKKSMDAYAEGQSGYIAEPFDCMLSYYGSDMYDVDIIKFPHHAQNRPKAMKGVLEAVTPELMLFTALDYRETTLDKTVYWKEFTGAYCANDCVEGLVIRTDGKAVAVCRGDAWREDSAFYIFDMGGNRTSLIGEIK